MGLSYHQNYQATSHFKDRLHERYGIDRTEWKKYMAPIYNDLKIDTLRSERAAHTLNSSKAPRQVHYSALYGCYVVVDPVNFKLITIYEDPTMLEEEIFKDLEETKMTTKQAAETPQVIDKSINKEPAPLNTSEDTFDWGDKPLQVKSEFIKEIKQKEQSLEEYHQEIIQSFLLEQEELREKHRYKYAKLIFEENALVFDEFIKAYTRIKNGAASKINRDYLYQLHKLHKEITIILEKSKLDW